VVEAVRHIRTINEEIAFAAKLSADKLQAYAQELRVSTELLQETVNAGRLTLVNFAAGGIATPADAAMMMQLGCDGVFVGSGIFKSGDPAKRARAIVQAVTHYNDANLLAQVSEDLGEAMVGRTVESLRETEKMAKRGY